MALVETIRVKINKWGLMPLIVKFLPFVVVAMSLGGIGWFANLASRDMYRHTYISENALMPSQAFSYFRESEWNILRGYRNEVEKLVNSTEDERIAIVESWLKDISYKTAIHKWDFNHTDNHLSGKNVYGVLHAPRGDDAEAMVLCAPWVNSDGEFNIGGIALGITLARFFQRWSVWAKNIIVVFPTDSYISLRKWVEAYHTELDLTAGDIEGAIVVDYPSNADYFSRVDYFYEGLNGQLPNLDLLNTAMLVARNEGLKRVVQNRDVSNEYFGNRLTTLLKGVWSLAKAGLEPGPGCEAFSGWRINAITIKAVGNEGFADITTFGRIVESTFRSINNLLEKFHQSFFFYLLITPVNFISIGTYLVCAILISVGFSIMAFSIWLTNYTNSSKYITEENLAKGLGKSISIFTSIIVSCVVLFWITLELPTNQGSQILIGLFTATTITPIILNLHIPGLKLEISKDSAIKLQIISLIYFSLLLTTLALLNFSLSLLIGTITLPLQLIRLDKEDPLKISKPTKEESDKITEITNTATPVVSKIPSKRTRLNILLSLLSNPFTALVVIGFYFFKGPQELIQGLIWGWQGMQVWTWGIILLGWLPVWIVGVIISSIH